MARAHYDTAQVGGNHVPDVPGPSCSSVEVLDRLTGGVRVVEKKLTPVPGSETFCTSTSSSKKPTIMTGAIQVSTGIAPAMSIPPDFASDDVHPTLAQQFNACAEGGELTNLHQHPYPYHFEYVQLMVHELDVC